MSQMINSTHYIEVDQESRTISLIPATGHSATMFLLHGLGDTAAGWADAAAHFSGSLPEVKFILPTAPTQPVSLNGGMPMPSWYDIQGLDERAEEACEGIEESRTRIVELIGKEVDAGITHGRIVLGGFSQGAALSLYAGLQLEAQLGGVIAMSGYMPKPEAWRAGLTAQGRATPVLQCHGDLDPMVKLAWAEAAQQLMQEEGVSQLEFKVYKGMPHSATQEELQDVLVWLSEALCESKQSVESSAAAANLRQAAKQAGIADGKLGAEASKLAPKM